MRGISTGNMRAAVSSLVGEEAARGLSPNVVGRLKRDWHREYLSWQGRALDDDWVYLWADGIHSGLRGDGGRLCVLVVIGVNARGEKHFLAIEDGVRESAQSWREVLSGLRDRGLKKPPKLAVGDGALGFWSALSEVYPKAAGCLGRDREELLAFYDFPARHWTHLRTTNVIESAFATIRHRSSRAKGCVTRTTMLSMIYKMGTGAEQSWKRLRGFEQLGQVIEGVRFRDGEEVINENSR